jgi:hypothetical protein
MQSMVNWVVDSQIVKNTRYENLQEIIKDLGYGCEMVNYIPFMTGSHLKYTPDFSCSIFYGTINLARLIKNKIFAVYLNEKNIQAHSYISNLDVPKELFLNNGIMSTFDNLEHTYEVASEYYGESIFLRPTSGVKLFTGFVVNSKNDLLDNIKHLEAMSGCNKDSIIILSKAANIREEYRSIICNREFVDISRYNVGGKLIEDRQVPLDAIDLCKKVALSEWQPDDVYTCDIAKLKTGEFKILELNSFSCAGWYACDIEKIVKTVSEYTYKIYEEQKNLDA